MTTRLRAKADLDTMTSLSLNTNPDSDTQPPDLDIFFRYGFDQKIDEAIILNFNENVKAGTGNIILSNGDDTRIIDVTDTRQVSFEQNKTTSSKSDVIINPLNSLIPGTRYSIQIPDGAIQDMAGNVFKENDSPETTYFNVLPPNPLLDNNLSNENFAKIDDPLYLFFDEAITAGNGVIVISNSIDRHVINVHDSSQVTFTTDDNINAVIIDPTADLIPNTQYNLWISYGAINDLTGNPFLGASMLQPIDLDTISSDPLLVANNLQALPDPIGSLQTLEPGQAINTVEDISKLQPLSITQSISGSGTDVEWTSWTEYRQNMSLVRELKVNRDITLHFDEPVVAGNGNIMISNSTDTRTINIQDSSQVIFDNTFRVIINPEADLLPDSEYTLQISNGAIIDTKNNPYAGLDATNALSFTTIPDSLLLRQSEPRDEWAEFQVDDIIKLIFDENVIPGDGSITITNDSDTRTIDVHDTRQVTFSDIGVFINPLEDLQPHTRYSLFITDNAIQNADGKFFTGITDPETLNFTTIPDEPFLRLETPLNVKFDGEIVLEFSEAMTAGSGTIVISSESDTRTIDIHDNSQVIFSNKNVIVNPTTDLIPKTQYSVQITNGAITDYEENPYPGIDDTETLLFTTTTSDPQLQFSIPPDDFSGFMINWGIGLDFDEEIVAGNGTITLRSDTDTRIIDIHDTNQVHIISDKIIVYPGDSLQPKNLLPNTHYSVQISPGAIIDGAGNPYAGIKDLTALDFTTSDAAQVFEFF